MPDTLPLSTYSPLISLLTPFPVPVPPSGPTAAAALDTALAYLTLESHPDTARLLSSLEIHQKIRLFDQLLTIRPPSPALPPFVLDTVESTIRYLATKKPPQTPASQVPPISNTSPLRKLSLWRGDITTLNVTAIVNAANERLLGCFAPGHLCIDNVIHAAAGPQLRKDCQTVITAQGFLEPVGCVKVTRGYNLPARYVLHTVGPNVPKRTHGEKVRDFERDELASCYRSCLEAMEALPDENGGKTIAFCCVSTGEFGFPADEAVHIAVDTVLEYFTNTPTSSVTKVVFNVFTPTDLALYTQKLATLTPTLPSTTFTTPLPPSTSIALAKSWLSSSTAILITAGAGLSASNGLDYTSRALFRSSFPALWPKFTCLYSLFGYDAWPTVRAKWGYYFLHLELALSWPIPPTSAYAQLQRLLKAHGKPYFIRTSNADTMFARSGFAKEVVSTPQGSYELLQCMAKCRRDAVFPLAPYLEAARPYLDRRECVIRDEPGWEDVIPKCGFCGGEMFLCVRGGNYFNEAPFEEGEERYRGFVEQWKEGLVVLEIGAGFNTPGVIRWVDENLVENGGGRVKLVRVGLRGSEGVDWSLEGVDAVGIEGDAKDVVAQLFEGLEVK